MNRTIIFLVFFSLFGCASIDDPSEDILSSEFSKRKALSLNQAKSPESKVYFSEMAKHWNRYFLHSVNNCSRMALKRVELLLTVNEHGKVMEVIGNPWNKKSKCFAKAYTGLNVLKPPFSPFYISYEMD